MNWLTIVLGVMLGYGALLTGQGLRTVINRDLPAEERRKGYWRLNSGLVLVAGSVIVFGSFMRG